MQVDIVKMDNTGAIEIRTANPGIGMNSVKYTEMNSAQWFMIVQTPEHDE